jgi:hypothetical protein
MKRLILLIAVALSGCYAGSGGYRTVADDPLFWSGLHTLTAPHYQAPAMLPPRPPVNCFRNGNMVTCY